MGHGPFQRPFLRHDLDVTVKLSPLLAKEAYSAISGSPRPISFLLKTGKMADSGASVLDGLANA
jgi:hypothetical protein